MLRAMREALQAHAAAHPGEPFDHERHMPACMREARADPDTWASGGSRGGGGFDEEAGAKVVLELQDAFKPDPVKIVVMRRKTPHEDTTIMSALSDASLLRLAQGSKEPEKEVQCARNDKCTASTWSTIHRNLRSCLDIAFPGCAIEINTTGKTLGTFKAFKGEYVVFP